MEICPTLGTTNLRGLVRSFLKFSSTYSNDVYKTEQVLRNVALSTLPSRARSPAAGAITDRQYTM
jgi:hypothetical protein